MMYWAWRWWPWWFMNLPMSLHHGGGLDPEAVLGREFVNLLQVVETAGRRVGADRFSLAWIDVRSACRPRARRPSARCEISYGTGAEVDCSASIWASMPSRRPRGE